MADPRVFLFVDNSNIIIAAKEVALQREGRAAKESVRIQFDALHQLALAGRVIAKAFVVGSMPPEQRAVWERLTAATGIVPELYERGSVSGGEQGLDQCLQVHMLRAMADNAEPQVAVLLTGDGAGYDDGVGFHADMARMHTAGWGIEVLSWRRSCRRALMEWATAHGRFIPLDDYYEAITFVEGGRRSGRLDLSSRAVAGIRPSPIQVAEMRANQKAETELETLRKEVLHLKERKAAKDKGRQRFERRQELRERKK